MKLLELFNSKPEHVKVLEDASDSYKAQAMINGRKIQVWCYSADVDYEWAIEFSEISHDAHYHNPTGRGGEFQVFSFVKTCVEHVHSKHPEVTQFHCTADKQRASLYMRMMRKIPGWTLKAVEPRFPTQDAFNLYLYKGELKLGRSQE
jgi:hypothetical protein